MTFFPQTNMSQALRTDLKVIISEQTDPYENLALEKFLLENTSSGEVFLYLWQNERTVVCGRNQNIWKECKADKLLKDGGFPARRLSGGGCVYHDLGNLNFTFLCSEKDYDLEKQLSVIIRAVSYSGIEAQRSGRNDITINGAKFSGNAFYKSNPNNFPDKRARMYHHGTLMVDVNRNVLSDYLNVDKEKYVSKGVDSVKSRVCNLKDFVPALSVVKLAKDLIRAFGEIYGSACPVFAYKGLKGEKSAAGLLKGMDPDMKELQLTKVQLSYIRETAEFFGSREWLYKNNIKFNVRFHHRFDLGDLDLRLYVDKGKIIDTALFSDAMDQEEILRLSSRLESLKGKDYSLAIIEKAIGNQRISGLLLDPDPERNPA